MTLIAWNNGPILKNGAIGTEQACCCAQKNKACTCNDPYGYAPFTVTAEVTLGAFLSGSTGSCANADAEAQVNGTYVLPYIGPNGFGSTIYQLTLANGMNVEYRIRCTADGAIPSELVMGFCDLSTACFQRLSVISRDSNSTTLCGVEYGSTSAISYAAGSLSGYFDSDLYNPFGGPVTCFSAAANRAYFECTSLVTFQW
jgi:hypothetical protein